MLADRADEVIGHILADILITADSATPDSFTLRSLTYRLRLRLNVVLIILIGT